MKQRVHVDLHRIIGNFCTGELPHNWCSMLPKADDSYLRIILSIFISERCIIIGSYFKAQSASPRNIRSSCISIKIWQLYQTHPMSRLSNFVFQGSDKVFQVWLNRASLLIFWGMRKVLYNLKWSCSIRRGVGANWLSGQAQHLLNPLRNHTTLVILSANRGQHHISLWEGLLVLRSKRWHQLARTTRRIRSKESSLKLTPIILRRVSVRLFGIIDNGRKGRYDEEQWISLFRFALSIWVPVFWKDQGQLESQPRTIISVLYSARLIVHCNNRRPESRSLSEFKPKRFYIPKSGSMWLRIQNKTSCWAHRIWYMGDKCTIFLVPMLLRYRSI